MRNTFINISCEVSRRYPIGGGVVLGLSLLYIVHTCLTLVVDGAYYLRFAFGTRNRVV